MPGLEGGRVETQQRLDLALQHGGVLLEDARHLALVFVQFAGHAVFQQRDTFAHRRQRGLQFVRDVAQETRLVGVQLGQPQAQPFELLPDALHVGRATDVDRHFQPVLAQADDGPLESLEGPAQPHAERHRQHHRQENGADHQAGEPFAAQVEFAGHRAVAFLDGALHFLRDQRRHALEFPELARHGTFAVERGFRRTGEQRLDVGQFGPPARRHLARHVARHQFVEQAVGFVRGLVETFAQHGVVQDERLPAGPFHGGAAVAQALHRRVELQRTRGESAALAHQAVESEDRPQRDAAQQCRDQQEGQQQHLLERHPQHPATAFVRLSATGGGAVFGKRQVGMQRCRHAATGTGAWSSASTTAAPRSE